MKKIVFLQKTNVYSGAESVVITIMKLLPKDKFETVYVSLDGEIRKFVEKEKLQFYAIKDTGLKTIKETIEYLKPDIIHATDYGMSSYAASIKSGIPVVAHLHNNAPWLKNPIYPKNIFFAKQLSNINAVISVSDSIQAEFFYRNRMKNKNKVIHNIIDIEKIRKMADENEQLLNSDVLFLGRLEKAKNPILFCEIIKEYSRRYSNVKAVMIGKGELKKDIEGYISKYNLQKNISLLGFQENPYKYIKNCRILLMPSRYEGFGLAAAESLALGKPVLCSGVGGLKDIVDESCGSVCSRKEQYVMEMDKLLNDKNYYDLKSSDAYKKAEQLGNQDAYIEQIISVYNNIS